MNRVGVLHPSSFILHPFKNATKQLRTQTEAPSSRGSVRRRTSAEHVAAGGGAPRGADAPRRGGARRDDRLRLLARREAERSTALHVRARHPRTGGDRE